MHTRKRIFDITFLHAMCAGHSSTVPEILGERNSAVREKGIILRNLNMRAIKAGISSLLCRWRPLRDYLNIYRDTISFEDVAEPGSLRRLTLRPVDEYGLLFTDAELADVLKSTAAEMSALETTFNTARLRNETVLGSSGVTVSAPAGRVVGPATADAAVPRAERRCALAEVHEGGIATRMRTAETRSPPCGGGDHLV